MLVQGEAALRWTAVRLDSFSSVEGSGDLLYADDATGEVKWRDKTGEMCAQTYGPHAIRLTRRTRYGRE